ncbi:MAG: PDZ domain-containing protein, partial [Fibrobacter sp.]|nr:PDZ domain-containing protein [Fibrobacter sp.]
AVVKIDGENLPAAELGNSDDLRVGQWVIAVGNPFELLQTVTAGIVSAKGRSLMGLADYEDFIQTDASMNPGNSGGALANLDGQIIGINTAISSPTGGNVGIGFAIPINMAREIMDQLIANGKVSRGYLAIVVQNITPEQASRIGLDTTLGAYVSSVEADGPAAHAGIQTGDIIIEFNGTTVENTTDLRTKIAATQPGKTVQLTIIRNGRRMNINVELSERPVQSQESQ